MTTPNGYDEIARAYVTGVLELTAPVALPPDVAAGEIERGAGGATRPATPDELVEKAERLSQLSTQLHEAAEAKLSSEDEVVKAQGATQLMAKALSDLEVGFFMLEASQNEPAGERAGSPGLVERGAAGASAPASASAEHLQILLGQFEAGPGEQERGSAAGEMSDEEARSAVFEAVELTLFQISDRASNAGQKTFSGLTMVGFSQIGQAAGFIGTNIAEHLGVADKLLNVFDYFRGFVSKAYNAIISLLGPKLAETVGGEVVKWWEEWKEKKLFKSLIEKLYRTKETKEYLKKRLEGSQAAAAKLAAASRRVQELNQEYEQQVRLAEKLLDGLKYLGGFATSLLPSGPLIMGATYVALCGYIVLVGADYVDTQHLEKLSRLPGVRDVVEAEL